VKQERYVIVDTRTTCGNSVFFWCWDSSGYTCDLSKAGIYTEEEATKICGIRGTDKMYKYADVLKLVQHHVDVQDLRPLDKKSKKIPHFPHTYSHLEVRA
jgi:hypothetical protein